MPPLIMLVISYFDNISLLAYLAVWYIILFQRWSLLFNFILLFWRISSRDSSLISQWTQSLRSLSRSSYFSTWSSWWWIICLTLQLNLETLSMEHTCWLRKIWKRFDMKESSSQQQHNILNINIWPNSKKNFANIWSSRISFLL